MTIDLARQEAPGEVVARSRDEQRRPGAPDRTGTRVRVGPCVLRRIEVPTPRTVIDLAQRDGVSAVRLVAVTTGQVSVLGPDDSLVVLRPGDATFTGRGATYRVDLPGSVVLLSTVPIDAFPPAAQAAQRVQDRPFRPLPRTPLLDALVGTMCDLADRGIDSEPIASEYAGLGLVNLQASLLIGAPSGHGTLSGPESVYQRALALMQDRLFDPDLRPPAIAESLRVSLRYLHLSFERHDTSVALQIRRRRLAALRAALEEGDADATLDELARRFGFMSGGAMGRQFHQHTGMSVNAYRRAARGESAGSMSISAG